MRRFPGKFGWKKAASADDDLPPVARPWGWIVLGVLTSGAILFAAGWWGWPALSARIETRNLAKAQVLIQQQRFREAQLLLEQAVQANPASFEARRQLAAFYQAAGAPQALGLWEAVAAAEPGNDTNQLGLASVAVQVREPAVARMALAEVSPAGRETELFLRLAAATAAMSADTPRLTEYLTKLNALNPGDKQTAYNLAATQSASADPRESAQGRAGLIALARGDELRIRATLALLGAPSGVKDQARREELLVMEIFGPGSERRYGPLLTVKTAREALRLHMQAQPRVTASDAVALSEWLRAQGEIVAAETWLSGLAGVLGRDPAFLEESARCALLLRRWAEFKTCLRAGAWGPPLPDDTLDLAFAARVQQAWGKSGNALATWEDGLEGARGDVSQLRRLVRLAAAFEWSRAYERTLQELIKVAPTDTEAWRALVVTAETEGAAGPVITILGKWAALPTAAPAIRAEWLLTAALNDLLDAKMRARAEQLITEAIEGADTPQGTAPAPENGAVETLGVWLAWGDRRDPATVETALRLAERAREPGAAAKWSPRVRLALAVVLAEGGRRAEAKTLLSSLSGFRFLRVEETRREAILRPDGAAE